MILAAPFTHNLLKPRRALVQVRMDDKCQARDTSEPGNLAACLEEAPSLNPNSENAQMKDGTEQGMASEPSSKSAITSHTRPGIALYTLLK